MLYDVEAFCEPDGKKFCYFKGIFGLCDVVEFTAIGVVTVVETTV